VVCYLRKIRNNGLRPRVTQSFFGWWRGVVFRRRLVLCNRFGAFGNDGEIEDIFKVVGLNDNGFVSERRKLVVARNDRNRNDSSKDRNVDEKRPHDALEGPVMGIEVRPAENRRT
jgi:hypothetical protein